MGSGKGSDKRMMHAYKQLTVRKKRPSIFLILFCFLFRKEIIRLIDSEGKVSYTYLLVGCECGHYHCYTFWGTRIGDCILDDDGTINRDSMPSYTSRWERVKK